MHLTSEQRKQYASRFDNAVITKIGQVNEDISSAMAFRDRCVSVQAKTGIPWYIVSCVTMRETSFNPTQNIANGDPWDEVTTHVPKGKGPYDSWSAAAVDALTMNHTFAHLGMNPTIVDTLAALEAYNGLGYLHRGVPSPYLWAATNQYSGGKFVADGEYDAQAQDAQTGCAALLLALYTRGAIEIRGEPITVNMPVAHLMTDPGPIDGFVLRGASFVALRPCCHARGAMLTVGSAEAPLTATVTVSGRPAAHMAVENIGGVGYVRSTQIAAALGMSVSFDAKTDVLSFS